MSDIDSIIYSLKYGGDRTQAQLRDIAAELEIARIQDIAAAVQEERILYAEQLEDAARQLRSIAAYANTLSRRNTAELFSKINYGDIEAAAIRARNEATK